MNQVRRLSSLQTAATICALACATGYSQQDAQSNVQHSPGTRQEPEPLKTFPCPNDFYKWKPVPQRGIYRIINSRKDWKAFAALSGMSKMPPVDLSADRVVVLPLYWGGGRYSSGIYGSEGLGRFDIVVRYHTVCMGPQRPGGCSAVSADVQYDCRLIPVAKKLGEPAVRFEESHHDEAPQDRILIK